MSVIFVFLCSYYFVSQFESVAVKIILYCAICLWLIGTPAPQYKFVIMYFAFLLFCIALLQCNPFICQYHTNKIMVLQISKLEQRT